MFRPGDYIKTKCHLFTHFGSLDKGTVGLIVIASEQMVPTGVFKIRTNRGETYIDRAYIEPLSPVELLARIEELC